MGREQEMIAYIESQRQAMLDTWRDLVNQDSGSGDKEGLDALRDLLVRRLRDLGGQVRIHAYEMASDLIVADFGKGTEEPIILSGHYDTVFPTGTAAQRPFSIREGRAYGPGVLDMKGGLVVLLYTVQTLLAHGYTGPIRVVLVGDEEVGHQQSDAVKDLQEAVKGAKAAFNMETGDLNQGLVISRKGGGNATITVYGKSAHAGLAAQEGANAIIELAHKALAIQEASRPEEGLAYNVDLIEGGTVSNAIPDRAQATVDVRLASLAQLDQVKEDLAKLEAQCLVPGTRTETDFRPMMLPLEATSQNKALLDRLVERAQQWDLPIPHAQFVGGGSDAGYMAAVGLPVVCGLGVRGQANHTDQEFAEVESLFERTKLLALTLWGL